MTLAAIVGWMQVVQILVPAAIATEQQVAGWIRSIHGTQMTDVQMNTALGMIFDNDTRRKALAIADALGQPAPNLPPS